MKKIICVLLATLLLISTSATIFSVSATKSSDAISEQITKTYQTALNNTGQTSFEGACAWYVNWQLVILGINANYIGGDGNLEYDNYKDLSESSGGYTITAYPANEYTLSEALNAITANDTIDAYNILIGFEKTIESSGLGEIYGHTCFIHAIIDGNVYFSESYDLTINGQYYTEGSAIICSIQQFCNYYSTSWTTLDGVIKFSSSEDTVPEIDNESKIYFDVQITAPTTCTASEEIIIYVTFDNITAEHGLSSAGCKFYYDDSKLLLTNTTEPEYGVPCIFDAPDSWDDASHAQENGCINISFYDYSLQNPVFNNSQLKAKLCFKAYENTDCNLQFYVPNESCSAGQLVNNSMKFLNGNGCIASVSMSADTSITESTPQYELFYSLSQTQDYYRVTGFYGSAQEVLIPSEYNGLPVKEIGERAFGCDCDWAIENQGHCSCGIVDLTIPDSITVIGNDAFDGCEKLHSVNLGNSVSSIGDRPFYGCYALGIINVSEDNTSYKSINNCLIEIDTKTLIAGCDASVIPIDGSVEIIDDYAFDSRLYAPNEIKEITIPESVTKIGENAFRQYRYMSSLIISDSLTSIGYAAFAYCENLTAVNIGKSVSLIDDRAFYGCDTLSILTVSSDNESYKSANNCLIEIDTKTLLFGCNGSVIPLNEGVETISYSAFYGRTYGEGDAVEVIIPETVTTICSDAFSKCHNIVSIYIPETVTLIHPYILSECSNLSTVTVSPNNRFYKSISNHLIETETKTLLLGNGNNPIPSDGSVAIIGEGAFEYSKTLTNLVVPDTVTEISRMAFYQSSLKTIYIPDSVAKIDGYAFWYCNNLTDIYFESENWGSTVSAVPYTGAARLHWNCKVAMLEEASDGAIAPQSEIRVIELNDETKASVFEIVSDTSILKDNAMIYDIALLFNGEKYQPNGDVKVSITAPEGIDITKAKVWHLSNDGTLTDMNAVYEDGKFVFITDHFSYYVVAESVGTTFSIGDINMDGTVNQYDYILAKRAHFNTIIFNENQKVLGDMNEDGKNDQYDYILVKRIHFKNYSTDKTVEIVVE